MTIMLSLSFDSLLAVALAEAPPLQRLQSAAFNTLAARAQGGDFENRKSRFDYAMAALIRDQAVLSS